MCKKFYGPDSFVKLESGLASEAEAASTFEEGGVLTWGTSEAEVAGIFEEDGMSEKTSLGAIMMISIILT